MFPLVLCAQTVSGTLSQLSNQSIKLEAFNGFKTYPIASTTIDEKVNFKLNYSKSDYGLGYLISADNKLFCDFEWRRYRTER
jgi:hypothetical protein